MSQNAQLLTIPTEVLGLIVKQCPRRSLASMRQVCRAINSLADPIIFSTFVLDLRYDLNYISELAKSLAEGKMKASAHARRLLIHSAAPPDGPAPDPESDADCSTLKEYLEPALLSFKYIRSVRWTPHLAEPDWVVAAVCKFLSRASSLLEELEIDEYRIEALPLENCPNLRTLSVAVGTNDIGDYAPVLMGAPKLSSLSIRSGQAWENANLNDLLDRVSEPKKILSLTLDQTTLDLSESALRHLRYLRVLKIDRNVFEEPSDLEENEDEDWQVQDGNEDEDEGPRGPAPVLVDQIKRIRPKNTALWSTLEREVIKLEELYIDNIDHALSDYLGSYTGLRKLHLPKIDAVRRVLVDHLAEYFYTRACPKHVATLEELCLVSTHTSTWCFGPSNSSLFFQCKNLRQLQIGWDAEDSDATKNLYGILDLSAALPVLRELHISYSYNRSIRGRSRVSLWAHRTGKYDNLARAALPEYGPIDPDKHLRKFKTHRSMWKLKHDGDIWQYHCITTFGPQLGEIHHDDSDSDEE